MANTYKNIVVTPSRNSNSDDPKITFSGANTTANTDITLRMYPTSNGTLSFEGSAGQLFSINNDLTGTIYSVNDVSGIPSLAVYANGQVDVARFSGNTFFGTNGHIMTVVGNTWNNSTGTGLVVRGFNSVGSGITLQPSNSSSFSAGWSIYAGASGAAIGDGAFGFWNHTAQTYSFWADQSNNTFSSASSRAPIFYDSNDTTYFVNPNSTTNLYDLQLTGAKQTYLYINPGNGYEAMVRYNGGSGSGWYVGKRVASQLVGTESFHFYSEAAGATVGGVDTSGNMFASGSHRSPIFYDSNNTSYYVDPAASTALRTVGDWRADSSSWTGEFAGKIQYHSNSWYLQASGNWIFRNASASDLFTFTGGGTASASGDFRAPLFYDSNDTAYYTDPNSQSRLNTLRTAGNVVIGGTFENNSYDSVSSTRLFFGGGNDGYYIGTNMENTGGNYTKLDLRWHTGIRMGAQRGYGGIRFFDSEALGTLRFHIEGGSGYIYKYVWMYTGVNGFYSDENGAHWHPNNATSYGSWTALGTRNGYYGIALAGANGQRPHIMYEGSSNGGIYMESSARWVQYYNHSNNSTGINSSTTSSSYALYVTGAIYSTDNIVAYSDRRAKENIVTIDSALAKVLDLRGVYYNKLGKPDIREVGVIAQEINDVLPEVVTYDKENDQYGVSYGNITALLVEAVKELSAEVKRLKEKVGE